MLHRLAPASGPDHRRVGVSARVPGPGREGAARRSRVDGGRRLPHAAGHTATGPRRPNAGSSAPQLHRPLSADARAHALAALRRISTE